MALQWPVHHFLGVRIRVLYAVGANGGGNMGSFRAWSGAVRRSVGLARFILCAQLIESTYLEQLGVLNMEYFRSLSYRQF